MPGLRPSGWAPALLIGVATSCTTFITEDASVATDGGVEAAPVDGGPADAPAPDAPDTSVGDASASADVASPLCAGEADCARYVFVSSELYAGEDIGGAIGADGRCNAFGSLAGTRPALRGRSFQAWLSDDLANFAASARLTHGKKPYRLVDGTLVANDWAQLTSGAILHAIDVTEQGRTVGQDFVWTGTSALGARAAPTCTSWSINGAANMGTVGRASVSDSTWTNSGAVSCQTAQRLYCFEK